MNLFVFFSVSVSVCFSLPVSVSVSAYLCLFCSSPTISTIRSKIAGSARSIPPCLTGRVRDLSRIPRVSGRSHSVACHHRIRHTLQRASPSGTCAFLILLGAAHIQRVLSAVCVCVCVVEEVIDHCSSPFSSLPSSSILFVSALFGGALQV